MQRDTIIAVLGILRTAYPRFYANMTKKEAEETIALWQEMFIDTNPHILLLAVKSLISHFEFPPSIADIKKEIVKHTNKEETIDYWNEAYKMICNGSYMTEEEFESHSDICKRYFGSVSRLKEKSRTENLNLEVEQSLFNKTAESLRQRETEKNMLPQDIRTKLNELTNKMLLSD